MINDDSYERAYRRAHPRMFPHSPHERQRELRDLWPADQRKFRELVDAVRVDEIKKDGAWPGWVTKW